CRVRKTRSGTRTKSISSQPPWWARTTVRAVIGTKLPGDRCGKRPGETPEVRARLARTPRGGNGHAAREAALEAPVRRGRDQRSVHRLRGLRDRLPPRRPRLQGHRGRLQAVPPRGGARP